MAEPPNNFSSNWRGPGHGACNMTRVKWLSHVATEQHPGNASAFADAFLKGCDQPSAWRFKDAATYFDHAWRTCKVRNGALANDQALVVVPWHTKRT